MIHSYTDRQICTERHTQKTGKTQTDLLYLNIYQIPFSWPFFLFSETHRWFIICTGLLSPYLQMWCDVVWCLPGAGCCGTVLDPYKERIESLERGFLVDSSALLLLFSLNRSRSDWTGAAPAVPTAPEVAPTPGPAGVLPAALVELTCTDQGT